MTSDDVALRLPPALQHLLPWVHLFGISDDGARAEAIEAANVEQLRGLVHAIDETNDEDLFGWLAGPESYSRSPSLEYVRVSALVMAYEVARLRLGANGG